MIRKIMLTLIIPLIMISLTGCWDLKDIDNRAVILAVGIDFADNPQPPYYEGSNLIKLTLQLAISQKLSGGAGQAPPMGSDTVWNVTGVGPNIAVAIDHIQNRLKNTVFLGHTRVIVISQKVAQGGINKFLNYFRNNPEFRRLSYLIISRGKAGELLDTFPKSSVIQALFLMRMIETSAASGTMPDISFMEFVIRLVEKGIDPVTILMDSKEGKLSNVGMAVFKGDKMVGTLDRYETTNFIQISESKPGGIEVIRDVQSEQGTISVLFSGVESHIKPSLSKDGKLQFVIEIKYEGKTFYQQTQTDYTDPIFLDALEKRVSQEMKREMEVLVYKAQHKYKADIFGLGEEVRAYMPKEWKKITDWRKRYPKVNIDVQIDAKVRRFGMSTFKQK